MRTDVWESTMNINAQCVMCMSSFCDLKKPISKIYCYLLRVYLSIDPPFFLPTSLCIKNINAWPIDIMLVMKYIDHYGFIGITEYFGQIIQCSLSAATTLVVVTFEDPPDTNIIKLR